MERVNNHNSKLNPNFINSWIIEPLSLCDDLIEYFELNKANQKKGITVEGLNTDIKDSIDIVIRPEKIILPECSSNICIRQRKIGS